MSFAAEMLALVDKYEPPALPARVQPKPKEVFDAAAIRRAAARLCLKRGGQRTRTPAYVLATLHAEYKRLKSLTKAGKAFGVSANNLHYLFKKYQLPMRPRVVRQRVLYQGRHFSWDGKYFRHDTRAGATFLHRVKWEERHGPVPDGHRLIFIGTDRTDYSDASWRCVSRKDYLRHIAAQRSPQARKPAVEV